MRIAACTLILAAAGSAPALADPATTATANLTKEEAPKPDFVMKRVCVGDDMIGTRTSRRTCTMQKVPRKPSDKDSHRK